jgi:hypothetical protein
VVVEVSMVPLLAPRARVLLLSCSFESFTRRRRRGSSARRLVVSALCAGATSPWPSAGGPGVLGSEDAFCCRAGEEDILHHGLAYRTTTATAASAKSWAEAEHGQ